MFQIRVRRILFLLVPLQTSPVLISQSKDKRWPEIESIEEETQVTGLPFRLMVDFLRDGRRR